MEIKLKLRDAMAANAAFAQCESVKDAKTRWNIVKNKRVLQAHADDYEELRVKLVLELSPENKDISKEGVAVQEKFRTHTKELLDAECPSAGLLTVDKKHILEANVSLHIVEAIFPFIVDKEDVCQKSDSPEQPKS